MPVPRGLIPAAILAAALLALIPTAPAQQGGGPPPVTVAHPVQREVVAWDEYTGRFEAAQHVEVRARVSGYLDSIEFVDGQRVEKGDLLYVIDPKPYEATVERARAALARAESQAALARVELARVERLVKSNTIAQEEVDSRRANLAITRADVAAAEADLRAAELNLSFTRITAPIAGRMSASEADVGNLVTGGSSSATLLTTLVSTEPVHFVFDANESEYLKYRRLHGVSGRPSPENPIGPVYVRLLDETEWAREGRIEFSDNVFDQDTGTLRLRATFANPDELLLPGVFGRLRVAAGRPYQAVLIDPRAVLSDQRAKVVMTVDGEGTVHPRPVELGPVIEGLQVVRSGLSPEDRIIVTGLLRARPGSQVTPDVVPMPGAGE